MNTDDLFKEQFPAGMPFGKKKPSLALVPEQGSQRAYFEDDPEVGVIRDNVYPNLTFRNLFDKLRGTPLGENTLHFILALLDMNQTGSEEKFFRSYKKQFNFAFY